jgi:hypothetical protein
MAGILTAMTPDPFGERQPLRDRKKAGTCGAVTVMTERAAAVTFPMAASCPASGSPERRATGVAARSESA